MSRGFSHAIRSRRFVHVLVVAVAVGVPGVGRTVAQPPPTATVEHLGDYAQLRQTDDHVYGYVLQLWRDGARIVGLWSMASGEPADFPTVRVDDLSWDGASGVIRFTVRACGSTSRVAGVAAESEIAARITDLRTGTVTDVRLRRSDDDRPSLTRREWLAQTADILKRRTPRC